MSTARVLFKLDPSVVVAEHTDIGVRFDQRAPARSWPSWERFPFGASVAEGIPYLRDIAGPADRACLMQIEDDDLVEAIDRDRMLRAVAEREDEDAMVVDMEDL